jgi:hypothetical protein
VLRVEVWAAIYSSSKSVLRHVLVLYAGTSIEVTSTRSWTRGVAEAGWLVGLGLLPHVTAFLVDAPDPSWKLVTVASLRGWKIRGGPACSRPVGLALTPQPSNAPDMFINVCMHFRKSVWSLKTKIVTECSYMNTWLKPCDCRMYSFVMCWSGWLDLSLCACR